MRFSLKTVNSYFILILFLFNVYFSFAQKANYIKINDSNWAEEEFKIKKDNNCIIFTSSFNLKNFADSIHNNSPKISTEQIFLKLDVIYKYELLGISLGTSILIKLPYELTQQNINRFIPNDWEIRKISNDSNGFNYCLFRMGKDKCTEEKTFDLYKDVYIRCLNLINQSEKTVEYANYNLNVVNSQIEKNNEFQDSIRVLIDSLTTMVSNLSDRPYQDENTEPNSLGLELNNSFTGFNKSLSNFNLQKLNYTSISMIWKYPINSNLRIGIGYQYGETNFRTRTIYDSTSFTTQTNLGLNLTKSTIIRNLTEDNTLSFNAILLNLGYVESIGEKLSFDLSTSLSYCPRLLVNTNVIDGFADYSGYFNGISETLSNVSDLGLESNVSLLNNEYQTTNSLIQFSLSPGIQYESEKFFSRMGVGYSLLFFNQISHTQNNRSNEKGEFNSSLSTLGDFSAQTLTFTISAGIKF
jgi:hypothetical protein